MIINTLYYAYLLVTKTIQQKIRFLRNILTPKKIFSEKVELVVEKRVEN